MGATPIKTSSAQNTCPELTSSNCVTYAGPAIPCISICKGASITDVIVALAKCGTNAVCYTGMWVPFYSSIPTSGTGTGCTYVISLFGTPFVTGTGAENFPEYNWTKDGDLRIRGSLHIALGVTAYTGSFKIPLVSLSTSCFPINWTASQSAIIGADLFTINKTPDSSITTFLTLDYPSGILYLNGTYISGYLEPMEANLFFGSTTFNIS